MAIWQDLVDDHGFNAQYSSVKRYVHKLQGETPPEARVVIETDRFVAPCFNAPTLELRTARDLAADPYLAALGPDAITDAFDAEEAVRRLRTRADMAIGVALLDQRALAGVGNVFKSELLFIRRLSPFLPVRDLDDTELRGLAGDPRGAVRIRTHDPAEAEAEDLRAAPVRGGERLHRRGLAPR